ncbi:MAG: DUF131 domain-containing protein [Archaeoglobaceae archaeon]
MRWLILALAILLIAMLAVSTLPNAKYGAVVLIGPIPIVFASEFAMVLPMLIFAIALVAILILLSHLSAREILELEKAPQVGFETKKPEKKFGGIVLIGPLPIIFGDARIAIFASLIAIVLMVLAILLMVGWFL